MLKFGRTFSKFCKSQKTLENKLPKSEDVAIQKCFFSSESKVSEGKDFGVYSIVKPAFVTNVLDFPRHILSPSYATGNKLVDCEDRPKEPEIKNAEQIRKMRKSCSMARYILDSTAKRLRKAAATACIACPLPPALAEGIGWGSDGEVGRSVLKKGCSMFITVLTCVRDIWVLAEGTMSRVQDCLAAAQVASSTLIEVGMTTDEIDKIVCNLCVENNVYPSPLHYKGFPKSVCTSVNNVACHGIPDDRPLCDGDIINIDITVYSDGYHGDCSATYAVGQVDKKGLDLMEATKQCLKDAISICCDGEYFCSIGQVISESSRKYGLTVVPCFTGHGIGQYFHGPPDIYHCFNDYPGKMKTGMTFTVEPVLTQGEAEIIILEDGWTAVTADNARTAQFEHTILINGSRAEILTESCLDSG